jgi:hypothetical protein
MSLRDTCGGKCDGVSWQSRRMLNDYALATRLPRRYAPRNDMVDIIALKIKSRNVFPAFYLTHLILIHFMT